MTATFSIVKDPDGVLDYSINWAAWLDGDTITVSTWSVSGPDALLVVDSDSESTTVTTVWLSGGTVNRQYIVTNHITTAAGREDDRSITFRLSDK
jgi:hypothetical protein